MNLFNVELLDRCLGVFDSTASRHREALSDGTRWRLDEDKAISRIEDGTYEFYVERPPGQRVGMIIALVPGVTNT